MILWVGYRVLDFVWGLWGYIERCKLVNDMIGFVIFKKFFLVVVWRWEWR